MHQDVPSRSAPLTVPKVIGKITYRPTIPFCLALPYMPYPKCVWGNRRVDISRIVCTRERALSPSRNPTRISRRSVGGGVARGWKGLEGYMRGWERGRGGDRVQEASRSTATGWLERISGQLARERNGSLGSARGNPLSLWLCPLPGSQKR